MLDISLPLFTLSFYTRPVHCALVILDCAVFFNSRLDMYFIFILM